MNKLYVLRKYIATTFAFAALFAAELASTQFSIIYFQSEVPALLNKRNRF
jgi:hypothetical protein